MTKIHANARKHGLPDKDITHAWENYLIGAVRVPGEAEVRIGLDRLGNEVEMVGALLADGNWLVFHAMRPPTKKVRREIEAARRRA